MDKKNASNVLNDHKKIGKKLIPPLLQIPNIEEIAFSETILPNLIWISAIFIRQCGSDSPIKILNFLKSCTEIINKPNALAFMNNFDNLTIDQKINIMEKLDKGLVNFLRENLMHQHLLLNQYPLAFLFDDYAYTFDKKEAVLMLREDVSALLNRYSHHATKVQTTAFVSMCASRKITLSSNIHLPDLNTIFVNPDSEESKKVGAIMRATMNANAGFKDEAENSNWANNFWQQVFLFEECI